MCSNVAHSSLKTIAAAVTVSRARAAAVSHAYASSLEQVLSLACGAFPLFPLSLLPFSRAYTAAISRTRIASHAPGPAVTYCLNRCTADTLMHKTALLTAARTFACNYPRAVIATTTAELRTGVHPFVAAVAPGCYAYMVYDNIDLHSLIWQVRFEQKVCAETLRPVPMLRC